MKNSSWWKKILWIAIIVGICLFVYFNLQSKEDTKNVQQENQWWESLQPSEEKLALRQYDSDLCKNMDDYEKYLKEKYNVGDGMSYLNDFFDKGEHYDAKDNKTYYYIAAYDMVHSNELDTCIAAYKLETILPEPSQYIDGYREMTYSRYIVDSKDDRVLWERTADLSEGSDAYHKEFRSELDKYRDNLSEWEELRDAELQESEASRTAMIWQADGNVQFYDIEEITQSLFNKAYNDEFSDEEILKIQNAINEKAGYGHTRYVVTGWNYKGGGVDVIDAVGNNIQTVDISDIDLFTTEDYTYNDGNGEKTISYMEDYTYPDESLCYFDHNMENAMDCPKEMHPIKGTKQCFDLNKKEEIDCRLIKF